MRVDLSDLQKIINLLFEHIIEKRGLAEIDLDHPYYWIVPSDKKYDMDQKPAELDVGSLADDWGFVQAILREDNQPVAYSLTEIAPLLAAIGEVSSKQLAKKGG